MAADNWNNMVSVVLGMANNSIMKDCQQYDETLK